MSMVVVVSVLVALVAVLAVRSLVHVGPRQAAVVQRLGQHHRTVRDRWTLLVPGVDRLRGVVGLDEEVVTTAPQPVTTRDDAVVEVVVVVHLQVANPQAAVYETPDYRASVQHVLITALRSVIGRLTLEEALTSRDSINGQLRVVLGQTACRWGLHVNQAEVTSVEPVGSADPRGVVPAQHCQSRLASS
ncbi:SPFH domain-containing protein [Rhodococcus sp. X156]|uniref:SPFH domain-containing protein n=1 Tax=Rhodococcus sp. X156 TaxID=2499145 RepID=UPI000FDA8164|nr:SPFH domain-containing protein [Rhodococcus sp. X156]